MTPAHTPFRQSNLERAAHGVYQGLPLLRRYRWYRRLLGGKWAQVSGLIWHKRWVRVGVECVERVDEDWG